MAGERRWLVRAGCGLVASEHELREDSAGTVGFSEPGELVVADANGVHPVPLPLKMQWLALGQDWLTQDANREYIEARLGAEAWWDDAYDANMDEAGAAVTMTEVSAERLTEF